MTKRDKFINFIAKEIFENDSYLDAIREDYDEKDVSDIISFWEEFSKEKKNSPITENGIKIILYMQSLPDGKYLKAKDIAEGLFTSSRSVAGAMRKLVDDGFVLKKTSLEKGIPIEYSLSEQGREFTVDK